MYFDEILKRQLTKYILYVHQTFVYSIGFFKYIWKKSNYLLKRFFLIKFFFPLYDCINNVWQLILQRFFFFLKFDPDQIFRNTQLYLANLSKEFLDKAGTFHFYIWNTILSYFGICDVYDFKNFNIFQFSFTMSFFLANQYMLTFKFNIKNFSRLICSFNIF